MAIDPLSDELAGVVSRLRAENARLRGELRAVAGMLTEALGTPDRAARQKLLEMAEARAKDAGEIGGPMP